MVGNFLNLFSTGWKPAAKQSEKVRYADKMQVKQKARNMSSFTQFQNPFAMNFFKNHGA
jgi:hypothetical protein